jgi:hypothetical protein
MQASPLSHLEGQRDSARPGSQAAPQRHQPQQHHQPAERSPRLSSLGGGIRAAFVVVGEVGGQGGQPRSPCLHFFLSAMGMYGAHTHSLFYSLRAPPALSHPPRLLYGQARRGSPCRPPPPARQAAAGPARALALQARQRRAAGPCCAAACPTGTAQPGTAPRCSAGGCGSSRWSSAGSERTPCAEAGRSRGGAG